MNSTDDQYQVAAGGSLFKGIGLALLCHFAYLSFMYWLPWPDARTLGYMMFALLQFGYLFPLAIFYHKRSEGLTSNGLMIIGALSLLASAIWFGYAAAHGALPTLTTN